MPKDKIGSHASHIDIVSQENAKSNGDGTEIIFISIQSRTCSYKRMQSLLTFASIYGHRKHGSLRMLNNGMAWDIA